MARDRWYHIVAGESEDERKVVELIGRIIIAWGATDTVLSKLWWHLAFSSGNEMDRDRAYRAPLSDKLKGIRKIVPRTAARRDLQLRKLEHYVPIFSEDRHAIAHGYVSMTAVGPGAANMRNDRIAFAIDLPQFQAWSAYIADVAHQMLEEETIHYYNADGEYFLPDPIEPSPYVPTTLSAIHEGTNGGTIKS